MLKTCPYSGVQFEPKRRDQVFASPAYRRNYHNEIAAAERADEEDIAVIRKNLKILKNLKINKGERKSFEKQWLLKQGLDLSAITRLIMFENRTCSRIESYVLLKSADGNTYTIVNERTK